MGRRRKRRIVEGEPRADFYKPRGIPLERLRGLVLPVDGLEAFRLVDAEGFSQEEAASRMGVSRPTLCRTLAHARSTVARALSMGWAIRVEGGDYEVGGPLPESVDGPGRGAGRGAGRGRGSGPGPCREGGRVSGRGQSLGGGAPGCPVPAGPCPPKKQTEEGG